MLLLDTSFVIDLQREINGKRKTGAREFLAKHSGGTFHISLITFQEFAEGFSRGKEAACRQFLSRFVLVVPDTSVAWRASRLSRELRRTGSPIGDHDVWIAATALEMKIPLVTRNVRHFSRVVGLDLLTY